MSVAGVRIEILPSADKALFVKVYCKIGISSSDALPENSYIYGKRYGRGPMAFCVLNKMMLNKWYLKQMMEKLQAINSFASRRSSCHSSSASVGQIVEQMQ